MRSACDNRRTLTFSSFATEVAATADVPDRCEMCGGDGPFLECEMTGSGLSYRLFVCVTCGRELVDEVATLTGAGKNTGGAC